VLSGVVGVGGKEWGSVVLDQKTSRLSELDSRGLERLPGKQVAQLRWHFYRRHTPHRMG